jgi:hypothetical protein
MWIASRSRRFSSCWLGSSITLSKALPKSAWQLSN